MTKDALYTLEEMATATGVPPRTIRFYTSEGLLPPPPTRGRFALYGHAHRNRLGLIVRLKQALLPLATIRNYLPQVTDAQVMALLALSGQPSSEQSLTLRERLEGTITFPMETAMVGTPVGEQAEAYRFLVSILAARNLTAASSSGTLAAETVSSETSSSSSTDTKDAGAGISSASEPLKRKLRRALLVSSRLASAEQSAEQREEKPDAAGNQLSGSGSLDTWQRILLAPGVELHVRMPDTPQALAQLDQMIAEAKSLFQS